MNKKRRKLLEDACQYLSKSVDIIADVKFDEEYSLSNMPENLQESERCAVMEEAIDTLEDAIDAINDVVDSLSGL